MGLHLLICFDEPYPLGIRKIIPSATDDGMDHLPITSAGKLTPNVSPLAPNILRKR